MSCVLEKNRLFSFLCIYITEIIATSIQDRSSKKLYFKREKNDEQLNFSTSTILSTTTRFTSTTIGQYRRHTFEFNLKIIGILLACVIFIIVLIRLFVMISNSTRSSYHQSSNRRRSIIRPQIAVVEMNEFKPDLPPAYAEAVTNIDTDGTKLPSYEELRRENT